MSESQQSLNADDLQQLYQYALMLCQQPADAQDLLHSGVEAFLNDLKRNNPIKQPLAYVRWVIRNRFIDHYRHRQRWPTDVFEEQSNHDISPIDLEHLHITQQQFQQLWEELSPDDRDILYHWAVLGYSTDEACQLLDIPRGTFLSRIHRLRKKYRLCDDTHTALREQLS